MLARPVPKAVTATVMLPSIPCRQRRNSRRDMPLHPDSTAHHHPSITKPACSCVRANHRRRTPLQATDDSKRNATLPWTATGWPFGGLPIRCGLSYHRPVNRRKFHCAAPPHVDVQFRLTISLFRPSPFPLLFPSYFCVLTRSLDSTLLATIPTNIHWNLCV